MSIIAPCVTATDPHGYREQTARVASFAKRIHLDFSDGEFAPVKLIDPSLAYWPEGVQADMHLMFKNPAPLLDTLVSLRPHMVVIHAEASGDLISTMRLLKFEGIKAGVALLKDTDPHDHKMLIQEADHVLIFSGDLGKFGGVADLTLLNKVNKIRAINPDAEIGWDGGASIENVAELTLGGVEAINVGGAIQRAPDPKNAYDELTSRLTKK